MTTARRESFWAFFFLRDQKRLIVFGREKSRGDWLMTTTIYMLCFTLQCCVQTLRSIYSDDWKSTNWRHAKVRETRLMFFHIDFFYFFCWFIVLCLNYFGARWTWNWSRGHTNLAFSDIWDASAAGQAQRLLVGRALASRWTRERDGIYADLEVASGHRRALRLLFIRVVEERWQLLWNTHAHTLNAHAKRHTFTRIICDVLIRQIYIYNSNCDHSSQVARLSWRLGKWIDGSYINLWIVFDTKYSNMQVGHIFWIHKASWYI